MLRYAYKAVADTSAAEICAAMGVVGSYRYYRDHAGSGMAAPAHALSCSGRRPQVSDMPGQPAFVICAGRHVSGGDAAADDAARRAT